MSIDLCLLGQVALTFALLLPGCQKPPDYTLPVAEKKEAVIHMGGLPEALAEDVAADFEKRTGIRVQREAVDSMEVLASGVQTEPSRWDVIVARDHAIASLRKQGLLTALDFGELPCLKNLDWRFLDLAFDPGNRYSVPLDWGVTVLAYRKDKLEKPPSSWQILWDKKLAGHVLMPEDPHLCMSLSLLSLGYAPDSTVLKELEEAGSNLVRQSSHVLAYAPAQTVAEALAQGTCWVAPMDGSDMALLMDESDPVGWTIPAEGALRWMDLLAIPRDAEHLKEAHTFINYLLEPKPASHSAGFLMRATPNKEAEALVDNTLRTNLLVYPDSDLLARCRFTGSDDLDRRRIMNLSWIALQAERPEADNPNGTQEELTRP
ncbi:MAG: spermidine/putrescine ABC transporter substrate-binding protein [Lentisphaerota bacterium]